MAIKEEQRGEFAETNVDNGTNNTDVNVRTGMTNSDFDLFQKKEVNGEQEFRDDLYEAIKKGDVERVKELTGWTRDATRPDNAVVPELAQQTQDNANKKEEDDKRLQNQQMANTQLQTEDGKPVDPLMGFLTDPFGIHNGATQPAAQSYAGDSLEEAIRKGDWSAAARIMNALLAREQSEGQDFTGDGRVSTNGESYSPDAYGGYMSYDDGGGWNYADAYGGNYDANGYTASDGSRTGVDGSTIDAKDPGVIHLADGGTTNVADLGLEATTANATAVDNQYINASRLLNNVPAPTTPNPNLQQDAATSAGAGVKDLGTVPPLSKDGVTVVNRNIKKHGLDDGSKINTSIFTHLASMKSEANPKVVATLDEKNKVLKDLASEDDAVRAKAFARIGVDDPDGKPISLSMASQDAVAGLSSYTYKPPGSTAAGTTGTDGAAPADAGSWFQDDYGYYDTATGAYFEKDVAADKDGWQGDYFSDDGWRREEDGTWYDPDGTAYYDGGDISYADGGYQWADGSYEDAKGNYVDEKGNLYLADNFTDKPSYAAQDGVNYRDQLQAAAKAGTPWTPDATMTNAAPTTTVPAATTSATATTTTASTLASTTATPTTASPATGTTLNGTTTAPATLDNFSTFMGSLNSFLTTSEATKAINTSFGTSSFFDPLSPISGASTVWGTKFFDPAAVTASNTQAPADPLQSIAPTNPYYKPAAQAVAM
jgi:hypothetical protein